MSLRFLNRLSRPGHIRMSALRVNSAIRNMWANLESSFSTGSVWSLQEPAGAFSGTSLRHSLTGRVWQQTALLLPEPPQPVFLPLSPPTAHEGEARMALSQFLTSSHWLHFVLTLDVLRDMLCSSQGSQPGLVVNPFPSNRRQAKAGKQAGHSSVGSSRALQKAAARAQG